MSNRATIALGVIAAAFAVILVVEYRNVYLEDLTPVAGAQLATREAPAGAVAPSADQTRAWAANIEARPLFAADRRPPVDAPRRVDATPQRLPRLTAVLVAGAARTAIFDARDGGKPVSLGVGGQYGPYAVDSIEPGQVVIVGPDGRQALHPAFGIPQHQPSRPPHDPSPTSNAGRGAAAVPNLSGMLPRPAS